VSVEYPIFVFEKDDHSMCLIEDESRIFYHLEAVDIENGEYVFWDAKGGGVSIEVSKGKMTGLGAGPAEFSLGDALVMFAKSEGISPAGAIASPIEEWNRIQDQLEKRLKKGILSRIFSRL
jgi:hypothetical protein